ncbi:hypothetical protein J7K93_09500 [bacterium]|nr:hypothetical protein [bacterium]
MVKKIIISLVFFVSTSLSSQNLFKRYFCLDKNVQSGPAGNVINEIIINQDYVWIGARKLCRANSTGTEWKVYGSDENIGRGSVSAIAARGDTLWAATAFDSLTAAAGSLVAGGGLSWSVDNGNTWNWIPQPVDSSYVTDYSPTTTVINNPTYDIAITDSAIWIASFAGGLRKSTDMGRTWKVVTVDGNPFSAVKYLSHRVFSVTYDGNSLWAGSAGGVHKSEDGGRTWTTFEHQNQAQGISGNFVVAIANQKTEYGEIIWAATVEALGVDEYRAVSFTKDGGLTWSTALKGEFAHNFAFWGNDVYVVTDNGIFKSSDFGETWALFPSIKDADSGEELYTTEFYSIAVNNEDIWAGSNDGAGFSSDNGLTWKIFRAFKSTALPDEPSTYAYPNPFSPMRHNLQNGDGHVRFQYHLDNPAYVTVKVYDFGMNLVSIVSNNRYRMSPGDFSEVWNGRNSLGDVVANGVYFYSIEVQGSNTMWGKVIVAD